MKNYLIGLIGVALLSSIGCANGPMRQWLRGAPCNTCNPQIQQPLNVAPACNNGCAENAVGNGLLGRLFRRQDQQLATCGTGTCNPTPPVSMPASEFANDIRGDLSNTLPIAVDTAPPPTELYGNPNTVGRLELPPNSFNNQ